jgi:hypothetical protein
MRFAQIVFAVAAIYGIAMLPPLYFLIDAIGRANPPAITHAEFYYGFVGAAILWQFVFILIGRDPIRMRSMMPIAVLEKFAYTVPVVILYLHGKATINTLIPSLGDPVLGILFIAAYLRTPRSIQDRR